MREDANANNQSPTTREGAQVQEGQANKGIRGAVGNVDPAEGLFADMTPVVEPIRQPGQPTPQAQATQSQDTNSSTNE